VTAADLLKMSQAQLDDLFKSKPAGDIPNGQAKGTAIIAPGTVFSPEIAEFVSLFAWQGKTFDGKRGVLTNRILPLGLNAIVAEVYKDASWLDGKECIVLDYSKTSLVAHWIRDEIRAIEPNFYLGKVYWDRRRLIDFGLPAQSKSRVNAGVGDRIGRADRPVVEVALHYLECGRRPCDRVRDLVGGCARSERGAKSQHDLRLDPRLHDRAALELI